MEGPVIDNSAPAVNIWAQRAGKSASSPWGNRQTVVACSLEEVMSEQLASELQKEEDKSVIQSDVSSGASADSSAGATASEDLSAILSAAGLEEGNVDNDELIARMLQLEFDKEHNKMLSKEQEKFNGQNKVSISFENYKTMLPAYDGEDEEEEDFDNDIPPKTKWEETTPKIGRSGFAGKGKNITTKHDKVICGRRNAERLMEFPPEFDSGDGEGMDMQLPNHVYNKLKAHSLKESNRSQRLHEKKEHATAEHAVDQKTRLLLYKIVNAGVLESISGSISGGKESTVFHAYGGSLEGENFPKECAIKVFKTTLNEFKNREQYVHGDRRFFKDDFKKQNPRKIIKIWAEKEAFNLNRMKKFDVPCPIVVVLKKHVLVMSFIGEHGLAAPKLKETILSPEDLQDAYEQTIQIMKTLQNKCGLVHADLSEFNLLWHNNQVYVIDVSQAVDIVHPKAMEFLYRDCYNVCKFFDKRGAYDVPTPEKLFNDITGLDIEGEGADFVAQVQRYDKQRRQAIVDHSSKYKEYAFDYFFDIAQKQRASALDKIGISDSDDESGDH